MKTLTITIICLALVNAAFGFYYTKNEATQNLNLLNDFQILINDKESTSAFPATFQVQFSGGLENEAFNSEFVKMESNDKRDIYLINPATGQPFKYELENAQDFEHYVQKNGQGLATLIRNENKAKNPFRMLGTIVSDKESNEAFEIVPVNMESSNKRSAQDSYDSHANQHAFIKRSIEKSMESNEMLQKQVQSAIEKEKSSKSKRAASTTPVTLSVELLVVTDTSVLGMHQKVVNSIDMASVYAEMRVYYAHLIKLVDQRYQDSLATDTDMRIKIALNGFLFLNDSISCGFVDPVKVGIAGLPTYKNRPVVQATKALNAFMDYMNSLKNLPTFDHAVALFNKDIFSDNTVQSIDQRAMVVGFAPVAGVCTARKYSIVEDQLGFSNIGVIAHEIGHNLGSPHDGESNVCSASNNFLMSPSPSNTNLLNQLKFSACSINSMKQTLLNASHYTRISNLAQCLSNYPLNTPIENTYLTTYPGLSWTAHDQCRLRLGTDNATYCQMFNKDVCSEIWCRNNANPLSCTTTFDGAVDGTPCSAGKVCIKGICTANYLAPSVCPFGDEGIYQIPGLNLPKPFMTCQEGFDLMTKNQFSISGYCQEPQLGASCCLSCMRYNALACKDSNVQCPRLTSYCNGGTLNGKLVSDVCKKTCGKCPQPTCPTTNVCLNGGYCVNKPTDTTFGYECKCPAGFTGPLCETRISGCDSNPCKNGGTCLKFGSNGFLCKCKPNCSELDCSKCK